MHLKQQRAQLISLDPAKADADPVFVDCRRIGAEFHACLLALFFKTDPALTDAARRNGVF